MIECRYCTLATIQVFNCFPEVFRASRLEIVQVISHASLDHVHNFIPKVLVFAQKFSTSSLLGPTITCITLTNCTDDSFGDPGSTFLFSQGSFRDALLHNVEKLLLPILPCLIYIHSHHWIPIGTIKQFTSPRKVCQGTSPNWS